MKKTLISTFIAAACLTASGAAMAGNKDAVQTGTVTTTVTGVTGVTITLTDNPQTVTTEDVKSPGVTLTTLDIEATGLDLSSAAGGNIAVEVDNDHIDGSGAWLFKDPTQPNSNLKARPKSAPGSGWNHNPENRIAYRLQNSSQDVNIQLPIETNLGNTNVTAGHYELPVTVSFNTW